MQGQNDLDRNKKKIIHEAGRHIFPCFLQKRLQRANRKVRIFALTAMADFWNKTDEMQERSIAVRQTQ